MKEASENLIKIAMDIEFKSGVRWVVENLRRNKEVQKHIVVSNNKEKAIDYIQSLVGEEFLIDSKKTKDEIRFETLHDIYLYAKPNLHFRGHRCDKLHVHSELKGEQELIEVVLKPTVKMYSPEKIVYFD